MIDRLAWSGRFITLLMAFGLVLLLQNPSSPWGAGLVYAGLVLLILTPVARIVAAIAAAARIRDREMAILAIAVLLGIAVSVITSLRR